MTLVMEATYSTDLEIPVSINEDEFREAAVEEARKLAMSADQRDFVIRGEVFSRVEKMTKVDGRTEMLEI